jgi:hypothetical protein
VFHDDKISSQPPFKASFEYKDIGRPMNGLVKVFFKAFSALQAAAKADDT